MMTAALFQVVFIMKMDNQAIETTLMPKGSLAALSFL